MKLSDLELKHARETPEPDRAVAVSDEDAVMVLQELRELAEEVTSDEVNEVKASLEETTEKLRGVMALLGGCAISNREAIRQISEHLDLPLAETTIDKVEKLRQERPVFGDAAFAVLQRALDELREGELDKEGVMGVLTFIAQKREWGVVEALVAGATKEDEA